MGDPTGHQGLLVSGNLDYVNSYNYHKGKIKNITGVMH